MKERGRKNIVIVVRDKKNNVWSHKNFIISWHKVVMKSFFLEAGPKNGRGLRQPLINLAQPPIFCLSFGYLPLEEWRGDWHSFHRMETSFYQRAKKKMANWIRKSSFCNKHQINWKLLRGMRIITILQSNSSHSNYIEI